VRRWGWPFRITSGAIHTRKPNPKPPRSHRNPSGIDYAQLIETAHAAELARGVNYAALTGAADQIPGQLDLLTG
jgi:putative transposase